MKKIKNSEKIRFQKVPKEDKDIADFLNFIDGLDKLSEAATSVVLNQIRYVKNYEEMVKNLMTYLNMSSAEKLSSASLIVKYGKDEGERRLSTMKKRASESLKNCYRDSSKFFRDENGVLLTSRNREYWEKKYGYSEIEAKSKIEGFSRNGWDRSYITRKNDPNWRDRSPKSLQYFLSQGYCLEEAKTLLSNSQKTFSLSKCLEKYGPHGYYIWTKRQEKWQHTLNSKSKQEIDSINKRKRVHFSKISLTSYSKVSQIFFKELVDFLSSRVDISLFQIKFAENGGEYHIDTEDRRFFYDFYLKTPIISLIIEFHGVAFHPREGDYDFVDPYGKDYNEVRCKDLKKRNLVESNGFKYHEFFEDDDKKQFFDAILEEVKCVKE